MRRNGFTLIELLAVIVILAIIALIATPLILNVIDEASKGAFKDAAYGIVKSAELGYTQDILNGANEEVTYTYVNGEESSSVQGKKLNYKGDKPQNGKISVDREGNVAIAIHDGKYCARKYYTQSKVTISEEASSQCDFYTSSMYFTFDAASGTITEYSADGPKDVVIPSEIDGQAVTSIGSSAFYEKQITSVVIPESITSIGDYAFGENLLKSVIIPDGLLTLADGVFYNNELTSIIIPSSVTVIGDDAFWSNQLTDVVISDNVTSIGDYAFGENLLTSIHIPNSLTKIGRFTYAWNQITGNVVIPDLVVMIDNGAFESNRITSVQMPDTVSTIVISAFANNKLTSVDIPSSLTTIESSVFTNNEITNVNIPSSITKIDSGAFADNQITTVYIPSTVTKVGSRAFAGVGHSNITWEGHTEEDFWVLDDHYACVNCLAGSIGFAGDLVIPSNVRGVDITKLSNNAFRYSKLTSVVIPASITEIPFYAFADNQITSVTFQRNNYTRIYQNVFLNNGLNQDSTASQLHCTTWNCSVYNNFYGTWLLNESGTEWVKQ